MHPFAPPSDRPLVIGHRGAMAVSPENTLASFKEALLQGADGIECDVHLTRDGRVVVMHDFTLDRTTNGKGFIAETTYSEIQGLDAGSWYDPRFKGEPVPTLEAFLELIQESRRHKPFRAVIELKAGSYRYPGIEEAVIRSVREADLAAWSVLISFDHFAIRKAKQLAPEIAGGVLYNARPIEPGAIAHAAFADTVAPPVELLTAEDVSSAHDAGLRVFAWTASTPEQAKKLAALGVDAFGANHPAAALAALRADY